ncbi:ceramide-1-phosphate transfer protein [Acyrthosiphon pisum]|uniref:Glycolipid transfer protein domain-containing protein n=1 Tax=Acyrthosiphon pisum TaxID=7029 RepID=A0A8R2A6I9_ACYPI|nr:ceramide-1-phosphate transfer protein [Acyrthosiphon pisum]|eukprot:XP_001950705.1 PREDICTED: ceramide-1-phosphate transfer protein [Acyrthosiphon pisum]
MFSVAAVQSAFHESLVQDDDVDVKNYVLAYQELCKFCSQLGGLFGFVVSDLEDKIGLLNRLVTEDEQHFSTVQSMITHEISKELVFSGRSGSITLLRLHRGLEFIILFMSKLVGLQPNDSTTHSAQEAYSQTLAKHHSWLIRNGALFAMNFLPCQKDLYNQTLGDAPAEETLNTMPEMISKASMVHERVNNLLSSYEILNIP